MADEPTVSPQRCPRTLNGRILLVAAGFAGIYFLIGYGESAVPYLPWLFLLACPLMHVFMHRGHGGHGGHGKPGKKAPRPKEGRAPSPGPHRLGRPTDCPQPGFQGDEPCSTKP